MNQDESIELRTELHAIENKVKSLNSDICSLLDWIETQDTRRRTPDEAVSDTPKSFSQTCRWSYEDDPMFTYNTECDNAWQFSEGDIKDNRISFCPYCGKRISE